MSARDQIQQAIHSASEYDLTVTDLGDHTTSFVHKTCPADQLTAKTAQLQALLYMTTGDGREGFVTACDDIQENYMWACQDLASEIVLLARIVSRAAS